MADPEPQIHSEPAQVAARLHTLGVSEDVLQEAVQTGLGHAFACTLHDPRNLPGILAWGKTVRHLRDRLVPDGWTANNLRGYATVVSPDETVAIAVAAGDAFTGRPEANPSTRAEKGPATQDAIHENQLTFADVAESFPAPQAVEGKQTWLLLHNADEEAEEIRCELSLPAHMGSDGFVSAWRERIILGSIPLNPVGLSPDSEGDDEGDEGMDIPIQPRG